MTCWGCGSQAPGGELCPGCGRLQPFPPGSDAWSVLGLPRRLVLDRADLEARFHQASRRLHPDRFRLRSPEEQAVSLENAARLNAAYRGLRDPVSRVETLLEEEAGGAAPATASRPPGDLLAEIMELQEAREALAQAGPEEASALRERLARSREDLEAQRRALNAELGALLPLWDADGPAERARLLARMRDLLGRQAYLRTALRDLDSALGPGPDERQSRS